MGTPKCQCKKFMNERCASVYFGATKLLCTCIIFYKVLLIIVCIVLLQERQTEVLEITIQDFLKKDSISQVMSSHYIVELSGTMKSGSQHNEM